MFRSKTWIAVAVFLFAAGVIGAWWMPGVSAQERHHMDGDESPRTEMSHPSDRGEMAMPMMRPGMSEEEMDQYCQRMQKRHEAMQTMRRENTEKLNSLVESMKQARGTEKIESMENVLVELVEQHNRRGRMMMKTNHAMMGSMMGMHRMSDHQHQQMMQRMQDCPMTQGMMDSDQTSASDEGPRDGNHHE